MNNQEKDLIQLDIMLLIKSIWEKKILILLVTVLFTAVSLAYSIFLVTPQYSSTTRKEKSKKSKAGFIRD